MEEQKYVNELVHRVKDQSRYNKSEKVIKDQIK